MSGGVRNLRAMFENKDQSTSPPDRGRSPVGSLGGGSSGTSPRPLSKVRTSFVAVERSGQLGNQLGLKRETSGESSMAEREPSHSIDEEVLPETKAPSTYLANKPTGGIEAKSANTTTSNKEADKIRDAAGGGQKQKSEDPKTVSTKVETKSAAAASERNGVSSKTTKSTSNGSTKSHPKPADKDSKAKPISRPAPITITKTSASAKPSPASKQTTPRTPTTVRQNHPKESSSKASDKRPEKKPSKASLVSAQAPKPASKPTTTADLHTSAKKTRIGQSPPQTGFVKPKPKSPTIPVKLPASLTAHTTSSGSKTASATAAQPAAQQSLSRASGTSQLASSLQASHSLSRSPSRASTTAGSKASLSRNPSALRKSSSRPSLGPPPAASKSQSSRQSLTSQPPPPADESFLARMMRPTTSSASKTAEKVPVTPPKKTQTAQVKRPITRDGPPVKAPVFGKMVETTPKGGRKELKNKTPAKEVKPAVTKHKIAEAKRAPEENSSTAEPSQPSNDALEADKPAVASSDEAETATNVEAEVTEKEEEAVKEGVEDEEAATHEVHVEEAAEDEQEPQAETEVHEAKEKKAAEHEEVVAEVPHDEEPKVAEVATIPGPPNKDTKIEEPSIIAPKTPTKANNVEEVTSPSINDDELEKHKASTNGIKGNAPVVEEAELESESPMSPSHPETHSEPAAAAPSTPKTTKPAGDLEDPEDAKAREEIARLNAELMRKAAAEEADDID